MSCIMSIWREMAKPMPVPVGLVVKKGMNISRATSAGIGAPLGLGNVRMRSKVSSRQIFRAVSIDGLSSMTRTST